MEIRIRPEDKGNGEEIAQAELIAKFLMLMGFEQLLIFYDDGTELLRKRFPESDKKYLQKPLDVGGKAE